MIAQPEPMADADVDAQNPWPGLVAFTEGLRDYFHGRVDEAEDLLRRVYRKNLTILFGQSGLGKSSLLQAGLFPRLRAEGFLPIPIRLDHAPSAPSLADQVEIAASRTIIEAGARPRSAPPDHADSLWEFLHRRGLILETVDGRPIRPVLVFDQFEELFSIGQASEETRERASAFLAELADFVENRAPEELERRLDDAPELVRQFDFDHREYRVLVCLREDYLPHLEGLKRAMPSIGENRMRLTRMNGERALDAVTIPGGHLITPEVGRQVVRFVAGGRAGRADGAEESLAGMEVEPSLLCLVCRELNNRRLASGLDRITADLLAGSRERILQDFYVRCLADQPAAVREFVEDELVTDSGLRENIALERASKTLARRGAPASAIDVLVKRRLLHLEDRLDIQRVELTHDVLTSVVRKSRDERQGREAVLLVEERAREAREKSRKQRRRQQFVLAGMAVALVVVGGFGVSSYRLYLISEERLHEVERERSRAERGEKEAQRVQAIALREKERAEENRKLADLSFQEARHTVDELLVEMSQERLKDVPGLQDARLRFAQKAVDRYEAFIARQPNDASVIEGQARSLTALGVISGQVGSPPKALAILDRAIAIREKQVALRPDDREVKLRLAQVRFEVGYLYWSLEDHPKARPHLERATSELEALIALEPAQKEARLSLVRTLNSLGNVMPDAEAKPVFERARHMAEVLCSEFPDDPRCLEYLMPPIGNLSRVVRLAGDFPKALELEEKFLEMNELALKRSPQSPTLMTNRGIGYDNKARILLTLKRPEEASRAYRESIASFRSVTRQNPLVGRYQWLLADELRNISTDFSRRGNFAEARACYEESIEILEGMTQRADDRPMYAIALIDSWRSLGQFYEGNQADKSDPVVQEQNRLRCLDRSIEVGRGFAKKYPENGDVHFALAETLYRRCAVYEGKDKDAEALPFGLECVEVFRSGVCGGGRKPTEYQVGEFLKWAEFTSQCAEGLKKTDEIERLATLAYELGKGCQVTDGVQSLGTLISRMGKALKDQGRYDEALAAYSRSVDLLRPFLVKAPWHWYIRSSMSSTLRNVAECCQKKGDFPGEVKAWREVLTIWSGPIEGLKIAEYIAPGRPEDEAEAAKLRAFAKTEGAMKRFTVQVDFNGLKYPFSVFVSNVPWPKDPLEDQARWLLEERGGIIPQDVRDSFRRLHKLAYENNVSYVDLCVYALGSTNAPDEKAQAKKAEVDAARKKWLAEVISLADQAKANPASDELSRKLALAFEELASAQGGLGDLNLADNKEALRSIEKARDLFEKLWVKQPDSTEALQDLVRVEIKLGELYGKWDVKDYQKSYIVYRRVLDDIDQLATRGPASAAAMAGRIKVQKALAYLCKSAFTATEAASWYHKAMDQDDAEACSSLASLYLEFPEIAPSLPELTRAILAKVAETNKNDPRTCPALFAQAYPRARILQQQYLAEEYHKLAEAARGEGRRDDLRAALLKEFETRTKHVKLEPAEPKNKAEQARVAVELGRTYLEVNENEQAVEWTKKAADLNDPTALLLLADWYEKGTVVLADRKKSDRYRYFGLYYRGIRSFSEGRYAEALVDRKKVCEFPVADLDDFSKLGMCYGKLNRWGEAITAYTRGIELDVKREGVDGVVLNLLEALIIAEKPDQLLLFLDSIQKKGWRLATTGPKAEQYAALFLGFRAIALSMGGKDASESERLMLQAAGKPGYNPAGWGWDELDGWLKTTKLAPDRKAAVEKIVGELKRPPSS